MNWTNGEDRFRRCSFLGGFLQIATELIVVNSGIRKFCPQIGHTTKKTVNGHDRKLFMECELLVGARGFEPPTSRSRNLQPNSAPVTL